MRLKIIAASDNMGKQYQWQDYWIKNCLSDEIAKRGIEVVDNNSDIDIFLHGKASWGSNRLTAPRRFMWFLGHPDDTRQKSWFTWAEQFEHIWCMSSKFIPFLKENFSKSVSLLIGGIVSENFLKRENTPVYDIVFIGNSKPPREDIVRYLNSTKKYKMCIAGSGWQDCAWLVESFGGTFIRPERVPSFYNNGRVTFYCTHDDMRREGFLGTKVFDVFASSECLCIHEDNDGLDDVFRNIPRFKTKDELIKLVDYYLENRYESEKIVRECREDVEVLKFKYVVDNMIKRIDCG